MTRLSWTSADKTFLRLKEETEKIGLLYGSYEGEMRDSIKRIFDAKVEFLITTM